VVKEKRASPHLQCLSDVIDFLDFFLKGYHWFAFNMADSGVTAGTLWLLINIIIGKNLKEDKP
jgi:signal peptidase II